jgi:hypothetical protein
MKAKKIFEFQQGQNPYVIMGLRSMKQGDAIKSNFDLGWDSDNYTWSERVGSTNIRAGDTFIIVDVNKKYCDLFKQFHDAIGVHLISRSDRTDRWFDPMDLKRYFQKII